jgi:hypothetical protein
MRRYIGLVTLTIALTLGTGAVVTANHDHDLITPGTVVVDIADGQTEKCASDPGGHKFHENVHLGQPGTFAWALPNNPVSIIKTENATC